MALKDKYTWADFLRENPDKKGTKRTSEEGKKAFDVAYKAFIKGYLKERTALLEKALLKATTARDVLAEELKGAKTARRKRQLQDRIGQKDHAVAETNKVIEKSKNSAKQF